MRKRQRLGAYAVCVQGGAVLLSRFTRSGRWTLPGGGVDHGEHPRDAVVREVFEETGLAFVVGPLLDVLSHRFEHTDPDGVLVDVHNVQVLFGGVVTGGTLTFEIGGSSDHAAWIPLADLAELPRTSAVDVGLSALSPADRPR
ncbi:MAG: NUDIX domain-containing protein [Pseudonocardiales bacterium]|jgi:8-oxo-dGTP diphosphatase|nr:NUDIX domain-containing protein [Pseudonocardiales bacterium]